MARKSRSHSKDNNLLMFNFNSRKATFTCSIGMMTNDKEKGWINTFVDSMWGWFNVVM